MKDCVARQCSHIVVKHSAERLVVFIVGIINTILLLEIRHIVKIEIAAWRASTTPRSSISKEDVDAVGV